MGHRCEVSWTLWSQVNPQKITGDLSFLASAQLVRRTLLTTPAGHRGGASQQRVHRCALPGANEDMDGIPKCRKHPQQGCVCGGVILGFPFELRKEASQHSGGAFLKAVVSSEPALKFTVDSNEATEESAQGEGEGCR